MKIGKLMNIPLLCMLWMAVLSCGDDVYYTMENSDQKLCGKTWLKEYVTDNGLAGSYQLRFYMDNNKGQELTTTYDAGGKTTVDREFTWQWADGSEEGLRMKFNDNTIKYFDNVWVREHYLSGELEGEYILLIDTNYQR